MKLNISSFICVRQLNDDAAKHREIKCF